MDGAKEGKLHIFSYSLLPLQVGHIGICSRSSKTTLNFEQNMHS